jgi:hypothetical protein
MLLRRDRTSQSQVKAVEEVSRELLQRLVEASSKDEPAARQALALWAPGNVAGVPR